MKHNAAEFVAFVNRHFRLVQAMCRERQRFHRDDEIVSFLQRFEYDEARALRMITHMREVGILRDRVGYWSPPNLLIEFLDQLSQQHSLASPKVIQGWVASLRDLVDRLLRCIHNREGAELIVEASKISDLVDEIADVLHNVVQTVEENCERIAKEVDEFRSIEDKQQMRDRLERLVLLQDDYLTPVIRILDVNEELHAATDEISRSCMQLQIHLAGLSDALVDQAERLAREVVWLRQITIGRAEEARRDLAPLVEAATRESKIASGVHKGLDQIRKRNWEWLDLETDLEINDDKNSMLFSNPSVLSFLEEATESTDPIPPRLPATPPTHLSSPTTLVDLLTELQRKGQVDDLLRWILDRDQKASMDEVLRLFHALVSGDYPLTASTQHRSYTRESLSVQVVRWSWLPSVDANVVVSGGNHE